MVQCLAVGLQSNFAHSFNDISNYSNTVYVKHTAKSRPISCKLHNISVGPVVLYTPTAIVPHNKFLKQCKQQYVLQKQNTNNSKYNNN